MIMRNPPEPMPWTTGGEMTNTIASSIVGDGLAHVVHDGGFRPSLLGSFAIALEGEISGARVGLVPVQAPSKPEIMTRPRPLRFSEPPGDFLQHRVGALDRAPGGS